LAFINLEKKEVQVKIVYYGPGRGGKTTNLEYIHNNFKDLIKREMVAIKTHGDRTLFFDFLPFDIGRINGYDVQIQLYTVPGQIKYNATRKLVLRGVDGVVFVADSMVMRKEKNHFYLKNLQENLASHEMDILKIPLVLQYNKRDLENGNIPILSVAEMQKDLNSELHAPYFLASAINGINVFETLREISKRVVKSVSLKILAKR